MKKWNLIVLVLLVVSCRNPFSNSDNENDDAEKINLIDYELVYRQHSALAPGLDDPDAEYDAHVYCRVTGDTVIGDVPVYKYRFVKVRSDTAETTMNYMHITDTSIVNYAYHGNEPFIFLKRKSLKTDSVTLEETPYSTILFPYRDSAHWYTRPESSGVYSIKTDTKQETAEVAAGTFDCAKVETRLLPVFKIEDIWAEQWWYGTVLIKSFINYGKNIVTDSLGVEIGEEVNSYETFELESYGKITVR